MPTYAEDGKTVALFLFNHVITRFWVPQAIVTDHGSHLCNQMMAKLSATLGFRHENSTPYYPQSNGQVEAINKVLKTMLCRMVGEHKSNWNLTLFSTLWAYRTSMKIAIDFMIFQLVYGMESVLPIECKMTPLKLVVYIIPNTLNQGGAIPLFN